MKIIIDTLGADKGPSEIIKGSMAALEEYEIELIFVGNEEYISEELKKYSFDNNKVEIINATDEIKNTDEPALAIRRKKDSSMVVAMNALKDGVGDGLVSTGSTGALLAGGLFIVKRIKGIDRAALASVYPTVKGISFLLDMGANVECKPEFLKQFALMGSIYCEEVLNIDSPKVGLINIGVEEGKGDSLRKETYELLKESNLNFIGNYEARDIMTGNCNVMVCDGFTGNVILKSTEGIAMSVGNLLKESIMSSTKGKMGALLLKPQLKELKNTLDYREYGGAPLLGISKPVIKAHGSSDALAFKNAIKQTISVIEKDIINIIEDKLKDI